MCDYIVSIVAQYSSQNIYIVNIIFHFLVNIASRYCSQYCLPLLQSILSTNTLVNIVAHCSHLQSISNNIRGQYCSYCFLPAIPSSVCGIIFRHGLVRYHQWKVLRLLKKLRLSSGQLNPIPALHFFIKLLQEGSKKGVLQY